MNKISLLSKTVGPWDLVRGNVFADLKKIELTINNQPDIPDHLDVRVGSVISSPTPRIDVEDVDLFVITRLSEDILSMSMNLIGEAEEGQGLVIRFVDDGTPRNITWGASFASTEYGTLPTVTVANTPLYVELRWNAVSSTWDCITPATTVVPASHITGILGLSHGGTAVDLSASGGATAILAQDVSHVISARNLVAADIPNLDAAKVTTGTLTLARGGTNANLSATGGASQVLKQVTSGAAVTVGQLATADLSDITGWTDYSATSTINGWASFTSGRKQIWYFKIGKLVFVQFHIEGVAPGGGGSAAANFTVPFTSANINAVFSWSGHLGFTFSGGGLVSPGGSFTLGNNSTVVNCYKDDGRTDNWATDSTTKIAEGIFFYQSA